MAVDANVDTVSELLARAVDVCHAVRGIHSLGYTDRCDTDFARLLEGLTHSVKRVENEEGEYEKSLIKFACVQIGNDLVVHVNRVLDAFSDSIDVAGFRKLWPLDDVTALNVRLREVLHQCQDTFPSSHELCLPLLADLQLTGRELESEETETKSSIGSTEPVAHDDAGKSPGQIPVIPRPPRLAPVGLINDFILESLSYKSMHDRESQVTEAHGKTLDWIFDNSPIHQSLRQNFRDSFVSWLSSTELGPIYWITGKPGSGKSTLVRYLSQHPVALYHLRTWGGKKRVNTAGFFFWTSGSRQQRSQTGLLRYLLHQLLSSDPELIEKAFPDLWSRLRQMTTKERVNFALEWTVQDLQAAFHSLLDAALHSVNICLFIDGLDEFDGDHVQIINFFKDLTSRYDGKSLKLCLSSRPWDVFEKAFETSVPNTKLQDLSYDDMYRYATDTLKANNQIRRLMKQNPESTHLLVTTVVEQANGVFLWVRLAVERMLVTFQKNSKFEDQTSSEIMQTATLFQLMHAREIVADFIKDESSNSLTVWELAFALFKEDDVMALDREVVEASDEEIQRRCGTTVRYIQARFARLLNVHVAKPMGNMRVPKFQDRDANVASLITTSKVIYIHRTVRDWLMDGGAGKRLEALQSPDFDPHIRLQRSYVLRLKHPLEEIEHHRRLDEWYPDIALAMTHARYIVNDAQGLQRKFLNEMDKALSWLWLEKPSDPYDHWAKSTFGAYEVRMKAPPIHRPFLCLATKFGLTTYVCQEVEDLTREEQAVEEEQEDGSTPLLSYATEFLCSRNKTIFPMSSPKLVHWLLNNPSRINPGPNHKYKHFITHQSITPWLAVLRHLRDAKRREWIEYYDINPEGTSRWTEIVRELVQFSDVSAVISKDMWDPEITALGVMEMLEETYGSAEVQRIRVLMEKKMVQ
ncbi:Orc1-like, AAA ATPase domain [Fusarium oxysporum f. sp. vasinfectum]|nr:Orc1-like, AAA ATPase domain [Fusarium oxysporum f. sp. vasinfectum]